jgi:hypothetical protein
VLTGQPSLDEVVDDKSLAQLRQRTRLRQRLRPLRQTDTAEYIRHRLRVAGGDADEIFAPESFAEIHRLTLGTPRLINTLCDTALTACMVAKRPCVDLKMLAQVVEELGWRWPDAAGRRAMEPYEPGVRAVDGSERATLSVYYSGKLARKVEIQSVPFSIGRSDENVLVIPDHNISRFHACIERVDGRFVIEDHNSRNGLLVNHKKRVSAVLEPGDVITIAHIEMVFSLEAAHRENTDESADDTGRNLAALTETQAIPENHPVVVDFNRSQGK